MDTYNVALFVLVGLVIALIVTGGAISMFGEEPSMGQLGAGATVGAAAGAALGFTGMKDMNMGKMLESIQATIEPEMKTGLPTF